MELGRELVKLNLENMTIVGTIGELPKPIIVSNRLHNVPELGTAHFNFGYSYAFRADQWYIQE
jgi:peptide/nickel transport system substrate-binding protein